jgi:hypothetical protein
MRDKILATRVFRKDYMVNGKPVTLIATAEVSQIGDQEPYFSVTADMYEKYQQRGEPKVMHSSGKTLWLSACGQLVDEIKTHIPELAPYLQYHLSDNNGTPMHYITNSLYWAGKYRYANGGKNDPPNWEYFKDTARWFDAPSPEEISRWTPYDLQDRLTARLPIIQKDYKEAMERLFGVPV